MKEVCFSQGTVTAFYKTVDSFLTWSFFRIL